MIDATHLIFIHGLEGTSQGVKALLLKSLFPGMHIPDFRGSINERMGVLCSILGNETGWTIIGSSLGGLMGALFTCQHPHQVRKLVLLAPALIFPDFAEALPKPIDVPTIVYHGNRDELVPMDVTRKLAEQVFSDLTYHVVDDDHALYRTVHEIDWMQIL
jgi:pimeloyl-ACP methyl ester carboxylesterase